MNPNYPGSAANVDGKGQPGIPPLFPPMGYPPGMMPFSTDLAPGLATGGIPPPLHYGMPANPMMPYAPPPLIPPTMIYPPATIPMPLSVDASSNPNASSDVALKIIEDSLGVEPYRSLWAGNISDLVPNSLMDEMFRACGAVKRWTRVVDPLTGKPKSFGFCEFENASGIQRALRILNNFPIAGKKLSLKIDEKTRIYLDRFEEAIELYNENSEHKIDLQKNDAKTLEEIEFYISNKVGKTSDFSILTETIKTAESLQKLSSNKSSGSSTNNVQIPVEEIKDRIESKDDKKIDSSKKYIEAAYKDREKRWENREAHNEKNRMHEKEKEQEKLDRLQKHKIDLERYLSTYDDDKASDEYHLDIKRWKATTFKAVKREIENDQREQQQQS